MGTIHLLEGVRVVACVPCLGRNGHGGGCEVLHLLQLEIEAFGEHSQLCHVLFSAAWMAGDEIGDDLLVEVCLAIDAVEDVLEIVKLSEWRFAHQLQYVVAGVFWSHLQSSADMFGDEFAGILHGSLVAFFVFAMMQNEVVAHTAADETLLDAGNSIDATVDIQQGSMVGIEIGTNLRVDATGSFALLARIQIASSHAIHIGRRSAKV